MRYMGIKHFLCFFVIELLCINAHAFTGFVDKREYVNWAEHPYNKYVYTETGCTAQYVGPDLILTAAHCLYYDDKGDVIKGRYWFGNYMLQRFEAEYIRHGTYNPYEYTSDERDWALLRIVDPKNYTDEWFDIEVPKDGTVLTVDNIGWGALKILDSTELAHLRELFSPENREKIAKRKHKEYMETCGTDDLQAKNKDDCQYLASYCDAKGCDDDLRGFIEALDDEETGIQGLIDDDGRLKAHKGCRMIADRQCIENGTCGVYRNSVDFDAWPYVLVDDCDGYGGNSGGAFLYNGKVVGIVSKGADGLDNLENIDYPASSLQFAKAVADALKKSPTRENNNKQPVQTVDNTPIGNITVPDVDKNAVANYDAEISRLEKQIQTALDTPVSQLSDRQLLHLVDKMASLQRLDKLRENAKKMHDKETSTANKLIGAAGIGATGIGTSQALSALSEQRADKNAENDMRAYLATIKCDYGTGKTVNGGDTGIELPGGNELTQYVTQYKTLAADLKVRKTALGMSPGIESETIIDAAETGLYDNAATGKTNGAFTSLSRALSDETSADAQAWAQQKADTASKLKTGAIVAGVGAVGSAIANLAVNSKNKNRVDEINNEYEKDRQKILKKLRAETSGPTAESLRQALNAVTKQRGSYLAQVQDQRTAAQKQCEAASGHLEGNVCICSKSLHKNSTTNKCEIPYPENAHPTNSHSRYIASIYTSGLFDADVKEIVKVVPGSNIQSQAAVVGKKIINAVKEYSGKEDITIYLVGHVDANPIDYPDGVTKDLFSEYVGRKIGSMMFPEGNTFLMSSSAIGNGAGCATQNPSQDDIANDNRVDIYVMFGEDSLYGVDLCKPRENI